jgi:hypothetical protein
MTCETVPIAAGSSVQRRTFDNARPAAGFPPEAITRDTGRRIITQPRFRSGLVISANSERGRRMAAMKPRTGDGPLEVTKEGRDIVLRMPLDGGGRLVVEMTPVEAAALGAALNGAVT